MNIVIRSCICTVASLGILLGSISFGYAMSFTGTKSVDFHKTSTIKFADTGDEIKFLDERRNSGKLILSSSNGSYSKPITLDAKYTLLDWQVRQITTANPAMSLLEVTVTGGNRAVAYWYWLLGIRNGQLVTYISSDSLFNMGLRFGPTYDEYNCRVFSHVEDGKLIIKYSHIVEHEYGYQRENIVDSILQVDWDENAQWFSLTNI